MPGDCEFVGRGREATSNQLPSCTQSRASTRKEECTHSGSGIKPQGLEARGCDSSGRGGLDGKIELLEVRPQSSITAEGVEDE